MPCLELRKARQRGNQVRLDRTLARIRDQPDSGQYLAYITSGLGPPGAGIKVFMQTGFYQYDESYFPDEAMSIAQHPLGPCPMPLQRSTVLCGHPVSLERDILHAWSCRRCQWETKKHHDTVQAHLVSFLRGTFPKSIITTNPTVGDPARHYMADIKFSNAQHSIVLDVTVANPCLISAVTHPIYSTVYNPGAVTASKSASKIAHYKRAS